MRQKRAMGAVPAWRRLGMLAGGLVVALALAACDRPAAEKAENGRTGSSGDAAAGAAVSEADRKALAFFERAFDERLARSPMYQSTLGITDQADRWDDLTDAYADETVALLRRQLAELHEIDPETLSPRVRLSWRLFEKLTEQAIAADRWRHHSYPVNQMFGWQQQIPSFLINIHRIADERDAENYVARLERVPQLVDQLIEQLRIREDGGVMPPRFVYPIVIEAARNVISGAPFQPDAADSALWADFKAKLGRLDLPAARREALLAQARHALTNAVAPAYRRLIAFLEDQQTRADDRDGAWKLPEGEAYYQNRLETYTTTALTAAQIHDIGLQHVARIHDEMRAVMRRVGFQGTLKEFFQLMRTDPRFYLPETEESRASYLTRARAVIAAMKERLPQYFGRLPKADLVVKRVEPFRERAAGKAFYQQPAPDGSRPGVYYVNLYRMADMPTYQLEALAYHEGVPGHHLQIAIAQELEGVPRFQRYARFTAFTEGWGLYAEYLPKEMGFYEDPYADFGRLAMELWRAVRLVVDTGIHWKRWSREDAIRYHLENTPNPEGDIVKAVERYIVMPGQATAYMIGKQKILELRERAKARMGNAFDIRAFHDRVLENGPLPLDILEERIMAWAAAAPAG
ncbi:MAG: hypothetical protein KatS3mg119_1254 [Rhodothalassiaceae bacterium]|nr:MAG: hypothetical protein KatS3mg119_1254 [Rhodothalassiaceae bacterium]